jgi:hypothetical protein
MFDRLTLTAELSAPWWSGFAFRSYGDSRIIPEIADVEGEHEICASLYAEALRLARDEVL